MNEVSASSTAGVSESGQDLPEDAVMALQVLTSLESLPINEHVSAFENIHTTLRAALNRPSEA